MRRKSLVAAALVSAVIGAVLALLAPSAVAGSSPGNRGWVADHDLHHGSDGGSDRGSRDGTAE
jgi:hypothetical protein